MNDARDFWSRRRARVAEEEQAEALAREEDLLADELAQREARSDAEILEELDLPDPDTLQPGDDVRAFMAQAVPDRLRRRALRQLWKLNPVLANVDGLVDYGEDFTDSATVIENMQTTYQVGKGMLAHIQEMARQAEEAERAEQEGELPDEQLAEAETETEAAEQEVETEPDPQEPVATDPVTPPPPDRPDRIEPGDPERLAEVSRPRRMRFAFQE